MINSKAELRKIVTQESALYGRKWYYDLPINLVEQQILYKHAKYLRKAEFAYNTRKFYRHLSLLLLLRIQTRYGISIPLNVFTGCFQIVHLGSVIINHKAVIGNNCRIHPGVCIGDNKGKAPVVGDDVYFGPGSKAFGEIRIANGVRIGANAVVTKSCTEENAVLVGVPAVPIDKESFNENIISS